MGLRTTVSTARAVLWVGLLLAAGCQPSPAEMSHRLTVRMSLIDFSGLGPARPIEGLEVSAAIPRAWELLPAKRTALFTHRQWRTPSRRVAVGVVHVHLPLPMSAKTLVWLAKQRYGSPSSSSPSMGSDDPNAQVGGGPGRLLGQWTDAVGREWLEGENDRYHVKGYVVTCGFDAWAVYTGYRRQGLPDPVNVDLAARSVESVVPFPLAAGK